MATDAQQRTLGNLRGGALRGNTVRAGEASFKERPLHRSAAIGNLLAAPRYFRI
jgi:hypothetical protein